MRHPNFGSACPFQHARSQTLTLFLAWSEPSGKSNRHGVHAVCAKQITFQRGLWGGFQRIWVQMTPSSAGGVPLSWRWRGDSAHELSSGWHVYSVQQPENAMCQIVTCDMYIALAAEWRSDAQWHRARSAWKLLDHAEATTFCSIFDSPIFSDMITDSWRSCRRKKMKQWLRTYPGRSRFLRALGSGRLACESARNYKLSHILDKPHQFPIFPMFLVVAVWWRQDVNLTMGIGRKTRQVQRQTSWTGE